MAGDESKDFFISYNKADRSWAEWIAWQLEAEGYSTIIQAWDFRFGGNFVFQMNEATKNAKRTIAVLSPFYLTSLSAQPEWAAAFAQDPTGTQGKLLPIRVRNCVLEGLLKQIVYIDLVGLDRAAASNALLAGVSQSRALPSIEPLFPGDVSFPLPSVPSFPGSQLQRQDAPSPQKPLATGREEKAMQKIKALFLAANPKSTNRLAIDEEMHEIERKLRAAEHRDALVFQSAWEVRPDDLLQLLNQHQPHIVHFSGHGSGEGLSLAGEDGQERLVTTRALKALFTTLKDNIRLVLLNACYSYEQAQALVGTIDCVIGMKESIHDNAATVFASSFYRAIGFGRSIQEAFDQGITSLLLEGIPEEDLPELLVKQGVDAKKVTLIASANP